MINFIKMVNNGRIKININNINFKHSLQLDNQSIQIKYNSLKIK